MAKKLTQPQQPASQRTRVAGIDVGGSAKGFHFAILDFSRGFLALEMSKEPAEVIRALREFGVDSTVAVDCPPSAFVPGSSTREAERALVRMGYRIQWTRRRGSGVLPQEWMQNGERLWKSLKRAGFSVIETFPTAVSDRLEAMEGELPLRLLTGRERRSQYKDWIDACLCALVAQAHSKGRADELLDGPGQLGSIWLPGRV